jgi:hypothetical protein
MSDRELSSARHDPAVAYVVVDQRIRVSGSRVAASWGQDRIDDLALVLSDAGLGRR